MPNKQPQTAQDGLRPAVDSVPHNPPSPLVVTASAPAVPTMSSVGPKDKPPSPRTPTRKPVPTVSTAELETLSAADRPRPLHPSLFAPAPSATTSSTRPLLRHAVSDTPISPTDRSELDRGRPASASPPPQSTAPHTPPRQRSTSRGPPVPVPQEEDDIATLNFDRRPSQIDPLTPSFQYAHGGGSSGAPTPRSLTGTTFAPLPPVSPVRSPPTESRGHMRQRSSHTRQPSISLTSPLPSPGAGPTGTTSSAVFHGPQAQAPSADVSRSSKILPMQPARTRAPMDAFASVEMLQGQREHQDRTRGTEVFGPGGTYEGRASSISGEGGLPVRCVALRFFTFFLLCSHRC